MKVKFSMHINDAIGFIRHADFFHVKAKDTASNGSSVNEVREFILARCAIRRRTLKLRQIQ